MSEQEQKQEQAQEKKDLNAGTGWGRVAIGVRIGSYPDPAFFESWTGLIINGLREGDAVLMPAVNRPHAIAANFLTAQFLQTDCDSMLFLDDDMEFGPRNLEVLRESPQRFAMIGGLYPCRRAPFSPVVLLKKKDGGYGYPRDIAARAPFIETDVVGLGFTLIKRWAIEAVGKLHPERDVFGWTNALGEDGHFCEELQSLGGVCGINTTCNCGHRTVFTARWNVEQGKVNMKYNNFGLRIGNTTQKPTAPEPAQE